MGALENNGDGTYFQLATSLRVEPFPACLEWLPASIYTHDGSMYGLFSSNLVIFVQGFMIGQYSNSHGLARGIYHLAGGFKDFLCSPLIPVGFIHGSNLTKIFFVSRWVGFKQPPTIAILGCPRKIVNGLQVGYNPNISHLSVGYNPFTIFLGHPSRSLCHGGSLKSLKRHQELEDELDTIDAFVALGGEPDKFGGQPTGFPGKHGKFGAMN